MQTDAAERAAVSAPLQEWLDRLAQRGGAPGGGSASGVLLGIGAALLSMVLTYGEHPAELHERAARLRRDTLDDAQADAVDSAALGTALARPSDDPGRDAAVRDAALTGARSSGRLGSTGVALADLLEDVAPRTASGVVADLGVAAEAIAAGLGGALINLQGDRALLERHGGDVPSDLAETAARMDAARTRAAATADRIRAH